MKDTKYIKRTELKVGDIVQFYGARFEIYSVEFHPETDPQLKQYGDFVVAMGRWIEGAIEPGYFGPGKDFNFQGNCNAGVAVEI